MTQGTRLRRVVAALMCAVVVWLPLPRVASGQCMCGRPSEKRCCVKSCCCCRAKGAGQQESVPSNASFASCCRRRQAVACHVSVQAGLQMAPARAYSTAAIDPRPTAAIDSRPTAASERASSAAITPRSIVAIKAQSTAAIESQAAAAGCHCACCAQPPLRATLQVPQQLSKLVSGWGSSSYLPCDNEGAAPVISLLGHVFAQNGRGLHVLLCVWRD